MQQFYIRRLREEDAPLLKQLLVELDTSHYEAEPNFYRPPKELAQLRESYCTFEKYFDGSVSALLLVRKEKSSVLSLVRFVTFSR